jgi:hypothetical protein
MEAGWAWLSSAHACVVYTDLGISPGMEAGIERARLWQIPVEHRQLKGQP